MASQGENVVWSLRMADTLIILSVTRACSKSQLVTEPQGDHRLEGFVGSQFIVCQGTPLGTKNSEAFIN
jgi:hypothetical protein